MAKMTDMTMDLMLEEAELPDCALDVLVVGSACIDYCCYDNDDFVVSFGGKGTNQAIAAARINAAVAFVGCVGDDEYGVAIKKHLKANNVNVDYLHRTEQSITGAVLINVADNGNNSIVGYNGANKYCDTKVIEQAFAKIKRPSILLLQQEIQFSATERALYCGKLNNWLTIVNPAPVRNWPRGYWCLASIITPNQNEMVALSGIWVSSIQDAELAVEKIRRDYDYSGKVVITAAEQGLYFSVEKGMKHLPLQMVEGKTVDSTGASDAFNGVLAALLARGYNWQKSVLWAGWAAELSVRERGAQTSPDWQNLREYAKTR